MNFPKELERIAKGMEPSVDGIDNPDIDIIRAAAKHLTQQSTELRELRERTLKLEKDAAWDKRWSSESWDRANALRAALREIDQLARTRLRESEL